MGTTQAIKTDARAQVSRRNSRRFQLDMVWEGVLVGLAAGGIVTLYRLCLTLAERTLRFIIPFAQAHPMALAGLIALMAACCLVVAKLVSWEPYTQGSGIPQVDAEVMGKLDMPWHRVLAAKFTEGTLLALSGLSLGREGPSIQLGGMGGKAISRLLRRGRGEERLLVTCGAAAGMSAAFNAPLTGTLFAIEEIHKEFTPSLIISAMASAVSADFLVSQVLGVRPVLRLAFVQDLPHVYYVLVLLMGLVMGLLGALHNRGMFLLDEGLYGTVLARVPYGGRLALPFALTLVAAFAAPLLLDGGDTIVELLKYPTMVPFLTLVLLLVGKYTLTSMCFASGAPGGTLFPLCVMGMLAGAVYGNVLTNTCSMNAMYIVNFMVLGIAGLFSSVVRAPVTGVVLAFELTGSMDSLLAASIVSIVAYVVANITRTDPFYERLLGNLLDVTAKTPRVRHKKEKVLHDYTVGAGSLLEGRCLRDIDWPRGSMIVTVYRAGTEIVPNGDTRLQALDDLLVIMDMRAEDSIQDHVWRLCRSSLATEHTPRR